MSYAQLIIITLSVLLGACSSWKKDYQNHGGQPNLSTDTQVEDVSIADDWAELEIYEDLPQCTRTYLGTIKLRNGEKAAYTLPEGKKLAVYFVRIKDDFIPLVGGKIAQETLEYNFKVGKNEKYRLTYRERSGSSSTEFQVKTAGAGKFKELASAPRSACEDYKITNP